MATSPAFHADRWIRDQTSIVSELFTRATDDLQAAGVRVLTGSNPPHADTNGKGTQIHLTPLRFLSEDGDSALSLKVGASANGGPPRYVVTLEINGSEAVEALRRLFLDSGDYWKKFYIGSGMWLTTADGTQLLNELSDIRQIKHDRFTVSAVFLHSDLGTAIRSGVMVMGVLYRGVLDELCGTCRLRNLVAQLDQCLGGPSPRFQRTIRP